MPAVDKTREANAARLVHEDNEAVTVTTTAVKCPTVAAYNGVVTAVPPRRRSPRQSAIPVCTSPTTNRPRQRSGVTTRTASSMRSASHVTP